MNFWKPKSPPSPSPPLTNSPSTPPFHLLLHQAFTSLQTNVFNFLQNALPRPPSPPPNKSPAWARLSNSGSSLNGGASGSPAGMGGGGRSSEGVGATPTIAFEERFTGVPVYALSNRSQEFVLVSAGNSKASLGLFCFGEADAKALLHQMECMDPSLHNSYQVVPVALKEVIQLKVDGMAFRLIPEASQVTNAIKERQRSGISDNTFTGVPVFQSESLVLRGENTRYRPLFFRKEDLEKFLSRASKEQNVFNPALKGDIQVAALEDIIQGMKDSSISTWNDVVFIPPGFDVSTTSPPR
ncbi:unnamed protein product [Cuscuta epithymum]|uniref:Protein TIC 22-like, chloroplastic n=1 Tax=Cuscuta epithymum TaxID=186058 RepID=A0AAV0G2X1_9ASTE|nr:unnamed protein product [Cuscuta epithymum]